MNFSRRDFIKTAGVTTGTLALSSSLPLPAWADGPKGEGILTASRWGALYVEVKDGKVVSSKGALPKTVPNSLQQTAPDQVHTKARIKYPMVRKSYLENPGKADNKRGHDPFVRVSWEQALKLIHEQHSRIRSQYGPSSIFAGSTVGAQVAFCIRRKRCSNAT